MFGFTHIIFAWIIGEAYQYFSKKKISPQMWLLLLFGSILPDADFLLDWTFGTEIHRTFTHSILFIVILPLVSYLTLTYLKNRESELLAIAFAVGISTHLFLDMFVSYGVPLFWPNLLNFSWTGVQPFDPTTPSFLNQSASSLRALLIGTVIDMGLGTAWIFYLLYSRKLRLWLKFYI